MLENDNEEKARLAANCIPDTRVRHFYDGANQAGKSIAGLFAETNRLAWDIYMFFSETDTWQNLPPRPHRCFHQLSKNEDSWANPGQYRCGKALEEALYQAMQEEYRLKTTS